MNMSVHTYFECLDCRERVWVGQGGVIYTGEAQMMEVMRLFLQIHQEHGLRFIDEYRRHEEDGWVWVNEENYKERWKEHIGKWFWM